MFFQWHLLAYIWGHQLHMLHFALCSWSYQYLCDIRGGYQGIQECHTRSPLAPTVWNITHHSKHNFLAIVDQWSNTHALQCNRPYIPVLLTTHFFTEKCENTAGPPQTQTFSRNLLCATKNHTASFQPTWKWKSPPEFSPPWCHIINNEYSKFLLILPPSSLDFSLLLYLELSIAMAGWW